MERTLMPTMRWTWLAQSCLVAVLAVTPARASVVEVPATITGHVVCYNQSNCDKFYGVLHYGMLYDRNTYVYRSFLKFELDTLPDSCALLSMELGYYQYGHTQGFPPVSIRLIPDPIPLGANTLYWLMDLAKSLTPLHATGDGWVAWVFDSTAMRALDSCRRTGSVSFAAHYAYPNPVQIAHAYGYDSAPPPYLRIVYIGPGETDIQVVRAELATYPVVAGASQRDTASLVLTNRGMQTSDYFWVYATSPGLSRESTLVGMMPVGETVSVRLPLPVPDSPNAFVSYDLWSACLSDPWHVNDSAHLRCWVLPTGTYAAAGFDEPEFPPPGWVIVNNDSGRQCWQWRADSGMSHSGVGFTMCAREQGMDNDDWLISGPVCPKLDDRDSVGFFVRNYQINPTTVLEVWAMNGQQVADTSARLLSLGVGDTVYSRRSLSLDAFDGDTIYVGFRCRSQGDWNGLCLDDIWFSRVYVPGTCEPQGILAVRPALVFAPNPAASRFVTVRYDLAAGTRGKLTLRDVLGRTAKSFTLDPSGSARLDLRGFAPGVYVATLDAAGLSVSRKLILTAPK